VNALRDEEEADKILEWLKGEINEAWEKRTEIQPKYDGLLKPKLLEILKLLPKTNCRECGQPTCMVFSVMVAEGVKGPDDCPSLTEGARQKLVKYMARFCFEP
jgi:ArsR family metal-binding transcriptional regulator